MFCFLYFQSQKHSRWETLPCSHALCLYKATHGELGKRSEMFKVLFSRPPWTLHVCLSPVPLSSTPEIEGSVLLYGLSVPVEKRVVSRRQWPGRVSKWKTGGLSGRNPEWETKWVSLGLSVSPTQTKTTRLRFNFRVSFSLGLVW